MNSKKVIIFLISLAIVAGTATIFFRLFDFYKLTASAINSLSVAQPDITVKPPIKPSVKLMFLGDMMFDRGVRYYAQKKGGYEFVFEEISDTLAKNDLTVGNLEGPITSNKSVSITASQDSDYLCVFTFDPSVAKTLFDKNIKMVNLGNNHIDNFGKKGIEETKNYLAEAGVEYFGVLEPAVKEIKGSKIGFVSYSYTAKNEEIVISEIKKIKTEADIVVVFSHWGDEYLLNKSNKTQQELGHKFVDAGADIVIGMHPHVIEPMEVYSGKRIYYSLGNFIFDQWFNENVKKGMGITVKIDPETKSMEFEEEYFYLEKGGRTIPLPPAFSSE